MRAGDTFIRAGKHVKSDPHLWVVISDPSASSNLVAVSFTSQRIDKDQSCVILPGEHPFVTHESVILYAGARVVPESAIFAAVHAGVLKFHSRVSQRLLAKIRKGAAVTSHLLLQAKRILQAQAIIPLDPSKPP
jgi:hypothetical protein